MRRYFRNSGLTKLDLLEEGKYQSMFGMTFNNIILELGWTPTGHVGVQRSDQKLLDDYKNKYMQLSRIPFYADIDNDSEMASYQTYSYRFGSIQNVWKLLDIEVNIDNYNGSGSGISDFDLNGDYCRSQGEVIITNFLIKNKYNFKKEVPYSVCIPNADKRRKFDWYLCDYDLYIEFFGLYSESSLDKDNFAGRYSNKVVDKINLCKNYDINLLPLFQKDLNDNKFEELIESRLLISK